MANRARLRRDLGWGAAAIVLLSVTTDRGLLFDGHLFHRRRRARHRVGGRPAPVGTGERQGASVVYPSDADTMRCTQPGRSRHSRRFWDTGLQSDGGIEPEGGGLAQPVSAAWGGWGRPPASVSSSTSSLTSASTRSTSSPAPTGPTSPTVPTWFTGSTPPASATSSNRTHGA